MLKQGRIQLAPRRVWRQPSVDTGYVFVHFTQNIKTIPEGERHRKQRKMLNPVFSIAHMREMSKDGFLTNKILISPSLVPIFYEVTHKV
jgi:hypothetical protein